MSNSLRGTLTGIKTKTVISKGDFNEPFQYYGPPKSSNVVKTTQSGFIAEPFQTLLECVNITYPTTEDELKAYPDAQIMRAEGYVDGLAGGSTLHPSFILPSRKIIHFTVSISKILLLPPAETLITYLRSLYGYEFVQAGISWDIHLVNVSTGGHVLTIDKPASVTIYGTDLAISDKGSFEVGAADTPHTRTLTFVLINVNDDSARYDVFSRY